MPDIVSIHQPELVRRAPELSADLLAGQLAASSQAMYQRDFLAYVRWAGNQESALQPATFARWRTWLASETTHSPHTINRMLSAVKRLLHEAAVQGYITHERAEQFKQVDGVKVKALRSRQKAHSRTRISAGDMRRICDRPNTATVIGLRDAALLATLASSGARCAEIATLTIGQIEQHGRSYRLVILGKGQEQPRLAPLSSEAYHAIQRWIAARPLLSPYIFTSFAGRSGKPNDKPMSGVAVWQTVQKYARACDLEHVKPHDFRRFVGTQLASKDIRLAQKALGHKRIDTTARHYVLDELPEGLTEGLY